MRRRSEEVDWRAVEAILGQLADLEKKRGGARLEHPRLTKPVRLLLEAVGCWPYPLPMLHLVGSKGKGTTAAYCERLLRAAGLRTGLYLSPHLLHRRERVCVDGEPASGASWRAWLGELEESIAALGVSRFEAETALAFLGFVRSGVDAVICEAGVGGIGDATAAVPASVVCLTSVELEHTDLLGDTVEKITQQKAGVVSQGGCLVVGVLPKEAMRMVYALCRERQAQIVEVGLQCAVVRFDPLPSGSRIVIERGERGQRTQITLTLQGLGSHLPYLAALAIAASDCFLSRSFGVSWKDAWAGALEEVFLVGRLQPLRGMPQLLLDCAHTPNSLGVALEACRLHRNQSPAVVLFACARDKAVVEMLALIAKEAKSLILAPLPDERAFSLQELRELAAAMPIHTEIFADIAEAFEALQRFLSPTEIGLITGSTRLAGEILALHEKDAIG